MRLLGYAALAIFALDQASKYLVVHLLNLREIGRLDVWSPYLNLRMTWNSGINFGLFGGGSDAIRWIWVGLAIVISIWVILWVKRENLGRLAQFAAGMLVGGALGNAIDRIIYGAVADFLNMSCCGFQNPYAFNIADVGVALGAVGLILFSGNNQSSNKTT